jgi:hypothetical protein
VIALGSILALAIVAPATSTTANEEAPASRVKAHVDAVVIAPEIEDRAAIEDALRLRVSDRPISDAAHARNPREGELFAYVEVQAKNDRLVVRLVLSDARAYVRTIESAPDLRAREIAATVANLLAGIEEDDLPPDERDVALPAVLEPAPPKPVTREPPPPAVPPPRYDLGFADGGGALIGLAHPSPQGFAAAGGQARVDVRWRSGALASVAMRVTGNHRSGFALTRIRFAFEGGYALRAGEFELVTTLGATVEPWFVTQHARVPDGSRRPAHVLLGGLARISPGWRHVMKHGVAFRLAPFIELAGSAIPTKNGGVARVGRPNDPIFRVGGLELSAGLELGVWLPRR